MAELEAERQRRQDERIAAGDAVGVPLYCVAHNDEDVAAAVERARARKLAELRRSGEEREVFFEQPLVVITGVPRSETYRENPQLVGEDIPSPQYVDRYEDEDRDRPLCRKLCHRCQWSPLSGMNSTRLPRAVLTEKSRP